MKRFLFLLALCLLLSACTPQPAPEAAPETKVSQPQESEPVSASEANESAEAYVCTTWTESVLVDGSGRVRLRLPAEEGNLQLVREARTGQPKCCAAWLAVGTRDDGFGGLIPASYTTAVYDLKGSLLLEVPEQVNISAAGSVFWYQADSGCAVHNLDGGGQLLDGLASVFDLGSRLAVLDQETGTRLTFLDLDGRPMEERTLPNQYEYTPRNVWNGKGYVGLNYTDGTCGVLEESGDQLSVRYEGTVSFSNGCAIIERDGTYRCVDLESGNLVLESREPVCELLRESVLRIGEDGFLFLRDLQGQLLFSEPICRYAASDTDRDGWPDLLLAETTDRTVMLRADGTVLCECPFGVAGTVLLSNGKAVGSVMQERAVLLDAETGTQTVLREGIRMCEVWQLTETPGFLVWYSNGETAAYDVYAEDGTRLLEGLSDAQEAGPGVFRCTKDGQTGLLRLDGTWFYAVPAAEAAAPTPARGFPLQASSCLMRAVNSRPYRVRPIQLCRGRIYASRWQAAASRNQLPLQVEICSLFCKDPWQKELPCPASGGFLSPGWP